MKRLKTTALFLVGSISIIGLTGCGQIEQASHAVLEKAKTSAIQVIDDAVKSGSIEEAGQSLDLTLDGIKQDASNLLGEASEYLSAKTLEQALVEISESEMEPINKE